MKLWSFLLDLNLIHSYLFVFRFLVVLGWSWPVNIIKSNIKIYLWYHYKFY